MNFFKTRYRIVKVNGDFRGYVVQYKMWWFPFWLYLLVNPTRTTVDCARGYIERLTNKTIDVIEEYNPHFKQ